MPRTPELCPCCLLYGHKHVLILAYNITIIGVAEDSLRYTITNDKGIFVVTLLPTGNYMVRPEDEGFNRDKSRDAVRNVKRARTAAFRRLANGAFALAVLVAAALPPLYVNGKLSSFLAFIIVIVTLFLGLAGLVFHLQADLFETEDTK